MAYTERPAYTQPIPAGATIKTEGDEQFACWTDRSGRPVKAVVLPGGRCRRTVPGRWVGRFRDAAGKLCTTRPFGDRSAARDAAIRLEKNAKAVKEGRALPASAGRSGKVSLAEHLPDYLAFLKLKGRAETHRVEVERIIRGVIGRHGLTTPGAVDGVKLDDLLEEDRLAGDQRQKNPEPYALKTKNHWVSALKAFGNWMLKTDRVEANPFRKLTRVNHEKAPKRMRRPISLEQLRTLIATTVPSREVIAFLPGPDRAALYLIAANTGLRAAALFALTPENFTWSDGMPASVYSFAKSQKAGQAHGIPLNPDAARLLAPWLKQRPAGVPLFHRPQKSRPRTAQMLKKDLIAAGIPYKDGAGQQFDFHSLRIQFGVMLALAGVSLVAAQQLLQHSTPVLTANIYSRVGGELKGEVAKLPSLGASLSAEDVKSSPIKGTKGTKRTPPQTKKPRVSG